MRILKVFIITFALIFIAQVIFDLSSVQKIVKSQADKARMEVYYMRLRFKAAKRGM